MPYYFAPYVGSGTRTDPFRPRGSDQPGWSAIDIRPDASRLDGGGLGLCILHLPAHDSDPLLGQLADAGEEPLTGSLASRVRSRLSLPDLDTDRFDRMVARLLQRPPVNGWGRLMHLRGKYEVWLNGLLWEEPVVSALATDNFNRANESPLASPWVQVTGSSDTLRLLSNALTTTSGVSTAQRLYYYPGSARSPDQYSQAKQVTPPTDGNWSVGVRIGSVGAYSYYGLSAVDSVSGQIFKYVSGAYTELANTLTPQVGNGDVMRVEAEGSTIRFLRNGSQVSGSPVTDTSLTTAGNGAGLDWYEPGGSIDDWEGGDLAVAIDVATEAVRIDTSDPMTWTHTPVGTTPKGIVVAIVHGTSATDHALGVTYGGVAMTRIVRATDTVTEPGAAELWFLGSSIPTGAQTVSVDLATATTDDIHGISWSLAGPGDTEVIDFDSLSEDVANPTVTLSKGGRKAISIAAMYGGAAAPGGTLAAGNTLSHTHDLGAFYSQSCYETTVDTSDHTIGWSTLGADDLAFVALCVAETTAVTYVPRHPGHDHANPAVF